MMWWMWVLATVIPVIPLLAVAIEACEQPEQCSEQWYFIQTPMSPVVDLSVYDVAEDLSSVTPTPPASPQSPPTYAQCQPR